MAWSRQNRTGYEAALRRSTRALFEAAQYAADAGEEGAYEDLTGIVGHVESMRNQSITGRVPGRQQPPIAGQTSIDDNGGVVK